MAPDTSTPAAAAAAAPAVDPATAKKNGELETHPPFTRCRR